MGAAWIIGLVVYLMKRRRRKARERLIAEGKEKPTEKDLKLPKEKVIIPPDPAVLSGQHRPGEQLFPDRRSHSRHNSRNGIIASVLNTSARNTPAEELPEQAIIPPQSHGQT
jgi:hypothetical protein